MIDPSSKLIFQGSLTTNYNPATTTATPGSAEQLSTQSSTRRNKNNNNHPSSQYSVLYLDGRLECYPGDPFSVGSPHEASKPIHILHLNPLDRWSLISIPNKNNTNNNYPFTLSKQPPNNSLTHLGLDVEAMGARAADSANLKSKDRKSLKQILGSFRPKQRPLNNTNTNTNKLIDLIDPHPDLPPLPQDNNNNNNPPPQLKSRSSQLNNSKLTSPSSTLSPHSSIHLHQQLPNSLTFSTHSESSRKQWITAFLSVFRLMSDLESSSSSASSSANLSPDYHHQQQQQQTPIRSTHSNPSFNHQLQQHQQHQQQQQQQQQHTSRIPLAPISSQLPQSNSQTSVSTSQNINLSPVDLFSNPSPTHSHPEPQLAHSASTSKNPHQQQSSPSSIPINNNHLPENSPPKMAVAVPAWIKAVRNADQLKQEQQDHSSSFDGHSPQQTDSITQSFLPQRLVSKQNSTDYYPSREGSIDHYHQQQQHQLSSSLMSHSFSAPAPICSNQSLDSGAARIGYPGSKPAMAASIKSFGSSMVQNLKRAGSLTEWPEYANSGPSILQRMRESSDGINDSPRPLSPGGPSSETTNDSKRTWLFNVVKKKSSLENHHHKPFNQPSPTTASTSAPRSNSRTAARYGIYMLKGLSSTSSISSSSHHFPPSSRETDSLYHHHPSLDQVEQDDLLSHHQSADQTTFPQLPQPLTSTSTTTNSNTTTNTTMTNTTSKSSTSVKRPQTAQTKKAFSDWLTTTSSQAALRLRQSSSDFSQNPTSANHHQKSRSVTSTRWASLFPSGSSFQTRPFLTQA
ncbi:uncharacterized protein PGTG_21151 [Puccinia graminis f. sp. tritici CRL 75-36-700-3]|uniref:Uncharacterized protein n=1 Tax=Puccinia graminis f. sp. tritici (strain CRL 75-36-700-3 / race SCCL) TaxID=418459 RepID=H6QQT2_PUCGT|nr:uncharacterized protein PGTG_21151 [Puccinia graminis f. sp. tritici CRL 75-36-700-3]EHS62830.1 hypothetical protein PGTG_21151 [Puccinia graminis f. sp. tritici CRL 75-36-700-3]